MKKYSLVLFAMLSLIGINAGAAELGSPDSTVPAKTRAEVKAETLRAIKAGEVTFGDAYNYPERSIVTVPRVRKARSETVAATKSAPVSNASGATTN